MKFLTERISISESNKGTSIIISPDYAPKEQRVLSTWLIFWTLCGVIIASQLFADYSKEEKNMLFVWVIFWLYFEIVGILAWLWKKKGFEKIVIKGEKIIYSRKQLKKMKTVVLEQESVSEINTLEVSEKSFFHSLSNSYWNKGVEACEFRASGKNIRFGLKLNKAEAQKLVSELKKRIK